MVRIYVYAERNEGHALDEFASKKPSPLVEPRGRDFNSGRIASDGRKEVSRLHGIIHA